MNVKELKELLKDVPDNYLVVASRDPEGNGFQIVYDVNTENQVYDDGEIGFKKLTPELKEQGYTKDDLCKGKNCIVIWP